MTPTELTEVLSQTAGPNGVFFCMVQNGSEGAVIVSNIVQERVVEFLQHFISDFQTQSDTLTDIPIGISGNA